MRNLVASLIFTTLAVTYSEGAPGAGSSSKEKPDVVTATVRVLGGDKLEALATLCTQTRALTIANDFLKAQEKKRTVKVTVIAGDFSKSRNMSTHEVKKIITDKAIHLIDLAIIFLRDPVDREDIFRAHIDKIKIPESTYLGQQHLIFERGTVVVNEITGEGTFTPRKYSDRRLYVMDNTYHTYFDNKELENDSVYMGGFLLTKIKDVEKLIGIVYASEKLENPKIMVFLNLSKRSLFLWDNMYTLSDLCTVV